MNPDISRKAGLAMRYVPWDEKLNFIKAVEKAETLDDIPQPYRKWIEGVKS